MVNLYDLLSKQETDPQNNLQESYYPDEEQFYEMHPNIPTEIRKQLETCFDKRRIYEEIKYEKREKIRKLIKKFDKSSEELIKLKKRKIDVVTDEQEEQLTGAISAEENQIQKKMEKVTHIQKYLKDIKEKIDEANQEIKELEKNLC